MTPIRYPLDFTPWKPGQIVGFAGTWEPISGAEFNACREGDAAITTAMYRAKHGLPPHLGGAHG
ncbi:gp39 [Burkholderia phage Bcep1]|uniref:Gp39 n=1 Tax=Burkholderia phage Bcep1 TaxID=2883943 RepID=Q6UIZ2_9CAUD|nr:gp39 [Burkholderia phage Bcep1]AAQ73386.1 gp39 [Burkholderia phage Bcep1]